MTDAEIRTIKPDVPYFDYIAALRLREHVFEDAIGGVCRYVIDLSAVRMSSTPAFAVLVKLRSALLRAGSDLALSGVSVRIRHLLEINRLWLVLPMVDEDRGPAAAETPGTGRIQGRASIPA